MPAGVILGTGTEGALSLINATVVVAASLHEQPPPGPASATSWTRTIVANGRPGMLDAGSVALRADTTPTRTDGPVVTCVERTSSQWVASDYGPGLSYPPPEVPTVWAFQYSTSGPDLLLKHLPHREAGDLGIEAVRLPALRSTTIDSELTLGGRRDHPEAPAVDHGHCTVHELVIVTDGPLSDADMVALYSAMCTRWT